MKNPQTYVAALSLLLLGPSTFLHAQVTFGTITGTVRDSAGAVVPGVSITVTNQETGTRSVAERQEIGEQAIRSRDTEGELPVEGVRAVRVVAAPVTGGHPPSLLRILSPVLRFNLKTAVESPRLEERGSI